MEHITESILSKRTDAYDRYNIVSSLSANSTMHEIIDELERCINRTRDGISKIKLLTEAKRRDATVFSVWNMSK